MIFIFVSVIFAVIAYLKTALKRDIVSGIAIMLFFTGAGFILHHTEEKKYSALDEVRQIFLIKLTDYPEKKKNSYSIECSIEASGVEQLTFHPRGKLLIYYITDTIKENLIPGDILKVKMTPKPVRNNGNPCEFNYSRYMKGRGFMYYGFVRPADIEEHSLPQKRSITEYSSIVARKMVESFVHAGLKDENLGLVTALTIGDKEFLDKEHLTSFSRAGVMHVMAVSGMHVGMISLFLSSLLFFLKKRFTILKTIIIIITLWAFAFITGLSPSVMRATIMFSFLQAGTLIKRPGNSMNILLASAFILLVARPSMLFEAGFQLSYLAVFFIIAFYEPLFEVFKTKNKITRWLWQMTAISIVAQAGTFPLTVRLFNTFPVLFLISNIIIIPLSFVITIMALILYPLSNITPLASAIAWILSLLSSLTIDFTSFISSLPYSVITGVGMTTAGTIAMTIALALFWASALRVKKMTLRPSVIFMIIFFLCGMITILNERNKEGIIVYNIRGEALPAIQSGLNLAVISSSGDIPAEVKRHACTRGLSLSSLKTVENDVTIEAGGHRLAITSSDEKAWFDTTGVDILISPEKIRIYNQSLFSSRYGAFPAFASRKTKSELLNSQTYNIRDNGALILIEKKKITGKIRSHSDI